MAYFDKYARWPKKSLIVYAKYDLTFLPEFSEQTVAEFEKWKLDATGRRAPLRPLHYRRDAVQIHGRVASEPLRRSAFKS